MVMVILGISILQIGERWLCQITVEFRGEQQDYEAWGDTPGLAASNALQLAGLLIK